MKIIIMALELAMLIILLTGAALGYTPSIWITVIWVIIAFMETYECYKRQKGSE